MSAAQSWGAVLWSAVVDPSTGEALYVNPATGETRWQLDPGALVLPLPQTTQWWELIDDTNKREYYYSTQDKRATWRRPEGFVIPFRNVQLKGRARPLSALEPSTSLPSLSSTATGASNDSVRTALSRPKQGLDTEPDSPSTWATSRAADDERELSSTLPSPPPPQARGRHHTCHGLPVPHASASPGSIRDPKASRSRRVRAATAPAAAEITPSSLPSANAATPFPPLALHQPRIGLFRKKAPLAAVLQHQAGPLSAPLLQLPKALVPLAMRSFNMLLAIAALAQEAITPIAPGQTALDHLRRLCELGLQHPQLRDEIWLQAVKQLNGVPTRAAALQGWSVIQVLAAVFAPSAALRPYLDDFLSGAEFIVADRVNQIASHCRRQLTVTATQGTRGRRTLPLDEVAAHAQGAFLRRTFGESLRAALRHQPIASRIEGVPAILTFLLDALEATDAKQAEGIFRAPGDVNTVHVLRVRLDAGIWDLRDAVGQLPDAYTVASLLKMWLRDLRDPLIPEAIYWRCLQEDEEETQLRGVLLDLPLSHRRVLAGLFSYLQTFASADVQAKTCMSPASIAMCFGPALFRAQLADLATARKHTLLENAFVLRLLSHDFDSLSMSPV